MAAQWNLQGNAARWLQTAESYCDRLAGGMRIQMCELDISKYNITQTCRRSVYDCMKVVWFMTASDCSHASVAKSEMYRCGQVVNRWAVCRLLQKICTVPWTHLEGS